MYKSQLDAVLKANLIVYGIHQDVLSNIVNNLRQYLPLKTIIATGDTPVEGDKGYIKFLYELKRVGKKANGIGRWNR